MGDPDCLLQQGVVEEVGHWYLKEAVAGLGLKARGLGLVSLPQRRKNANQERHGHGRSQS